MNAQLSSDEDIVTRFERGAPSSAREADGALKTGCSVAICTYKRAASLSRFLDSLREQQPRPQHLVIVDASPDEETEAVVRQHPIADELPDGLLYFRVQGALKGLTRQRNFALLWIATDLVAFFDDDIVLLPDCLREMEKGHRQRNDVVGVGAFVRNEVRRPTALWRLRRAFRVVANLRPGAYCRSGFSIPWDFLRPTTHLVEGQWLRGCTMMWKTAAAREVGFNDRFSGYSNGEDLDFSLRIAAHGKIVLAGAAHVLHLHESSGRPDAFMMGYVGIRNSHDINRRCLPDRNFRDAVWFLYAYGMDALMRSATVLAPGDIAGRWQFLRGRGRFFAELLRPGKLEP